MEKYKTIFDVQAEVGLTKHLGSQAATEELMKLCHILPGYKVLDVGSGAGRTAIMLAKNYGLQMVGVDIHPGMVASATAQAKKHRVDGQVRFQEADAQDLPFADNTFDIVIVESVTAFTQNHQQAISEFARVVKKGGFVGLNESTYLQPDVPAEIIDWASQEFAMNAEVHTAEEWKAFLVKAGLLDVFARVYPLDVKKQAAETVKRYGFGGILKSTFRSLKMHALHPEVRAMFTKDSDIMPKDLSEYFGYGLYVGRKPDNGINHHE